MKKIRLEYQAATVDPDFDLRQVDSPGFNMGELMRQEKCAIEVGFTDKARRAIKKYPILERFPYVPNISYSMIGEFIAWPCSEMSQAKYLLFEVKQKIRFCGEGAAERYMCLVLDGGTPSESS